MSKYVRIVSVFYSRNTRLLDKLIVPLSNKGRMLY
ncbi:hypothetical protein CEDIAZO_01987 [Celerinatantimonas diazotrophica]|nr:hypothetical protein CEDIAZO_01987 [Celerinatantimonas diazotrophica]